MKYTLKPNFHDYLFSFIAICLIALLIVVSYLILPDGGDYAVVRYNNKIVKKMPMNVDADFIMYKTDYPDLYGDELIVTVKNKKVSITKEDSPLHYCSYLGEISQKGSSLICAPNCVMVTIESMDLDYEEPDITL